MTKITVQQSKYIAEISSISASAPSYCFHHTLSVMVYCHDCVVFQLNGNGAVATFDFLTVIQDFLYFNIKY